MTRPKVYERGGFRASARTISEAREIVDALINEALEADYSPIHIQSRGVIFIGRNAEPKLAKLLGDKSDVRGGFALKATDDAVMIAGAGEGPAQQCARPFALAGEPAARKECGADPGGVAVRQAAVRCGSRGAAGP